MGIDVHKSMLAVVVADAAAEGEFQFERRKFGTTESELRQLAQWLAERNVREAVMESTVLYWRPVWQQLEGQCDLYLAQAQSNRAPRGRKRAPSSTLHSARGMQVTFRSRKARAASKLLRSETPRGESARRILCSSRFSASGLIPTISQRFRKAKML